MEEKFQNSAEVENTDSIGITFTDLFRQIRVKWLWYVVSLAICFAIAGYYLLSAPRTYTQSIEVLFKDDENQSLGADLSLLGAARVPNIAYNEIFVLTSPEIMETVVVRLGLNDTYLTKKGLRTVELYKTSPIVVDRVDSLANPNESYSFKIRINDDKTGVVLSKFRIRKEKYDEEIAAKFNQEVKTPVGTFIITPTTFLNPTGNDAAECPTSIKYSHASVKSTARTLSEAIESNFDEELGTVVTLSITQPSAAEADDILSAVVDAYNDYWIADRNKISVATNKIINERLIALEQELGDVETNITDYKAAHHMLDMDAMAAVYLSQTTANQDQLNALSQEIAIARYLKSELTTGDNSRLLPLTGNIGDTNISTLVGEYNRQVAERNLRLQTVPEESPIIRQRTDAIERTREAILTSVDAALESLNKRYKAITLVDNNTQSKLATAPGQAKYLMSEERKQKVKESLYLYLLQRREENELSQAFTAYNTRMITEPHGSSSPTSPNPRNALLMALTLGLLLPTAIIYLKETLNTRVRSRRDIEDLPIPFLGEIPLTDVPERGLMKFFGRKRKSLANSTETRKIIVRSHKNNITNEAFRMVRTNIDFMESLNHRQDSGHGRTLMTVSLNAGSGKTFVSLNLASSFALKNKKTILIDLDLRKGTVSQNVGSPRRGIVDFLVGKETNLDSLIVKNVEGIKNLDILPEGLVPPNPTELLYSPKLEELIEKLRETYDYVIFDCPPVEIVADARLLNPYIDMTVFVIRSGLFEKSDLKVITKLYSTHRYNNLALILNATDSVHGVYGNYGYGYGYGNSNKR